ncbi:MAG TPA: flavin reductase family protein [Pseudolysinimonas sp.]|nr:flavin reductase family protein [Pseudolysinimonas sp.]
MDYRAAIARLASGVAIVSTEFDGELHGMIVTSVMSGELDPPLVLVSMARTGATRRAVAARGSFRMGFLAEDEFALAQLFSDPGRFAERAEVLSAHRGDDGMPTGLGRLAELTCDVVRIEPIVRHDLVIARVRQHRVGDASARALLRADSAWAVPRAAITGMPGGTPRRSDSYTRQCEEIIGA